MWFFIDCDYRIKTTLCNPAGIVALMTDFAGIMGGIIFDHVPVLLALMTGFAGVMGVTRRRRAY